MEPSTAQPVSNTTVEAPTVAPEVVEIADDEDENDYEGENLVVEELIDDEKDRTFDDELVGRSVKSLYENG